MSDVQWTRERLISNMLDQILVLEGKTQKDRAYVLDLMAEIVDAVDGKRPKKPMKISPEALSRLA